MVVGQPVGTTTVSTAHSRVQQRHGFKLDVIKMDVGAPAPGEEVFELIEKLNAFGSEPGLEDDEVRAALAQLCCPNHLACALAVLAYHVHACVIRRNQRELI